MLGRLSKKPGISLPRPLESIDSPRYERDRKAMPHKLWSVQKANSYQYQYQRNCH